MDDNVIGFKPKDRSMHEKLTEIFGSSNYITFNFTPSGAVAWWSGEGMTDEQLSYLNKLMDIITTETIKHNTEITTL